MHLITGKVGTDHITSANDGFKNAHVFGDGSFVFNEGGSFTATKIDNNTVRIGKGQGYIQGRLFEMTTYEEVNILSGTESFNRCDLIVARYEKDANTQLESIRLVAIAGERTASGFVPPACIEGDILAGDLIADFPLCKVNISGLEIDSIVSASTIANVKDLLTLESEILEIAEQSIPESIVREIVDEYVEEHQADLVSQNDFSDYQTQVDNKFDVVDEDIDDLKEDLAKYGFNKITTPFTKGKFVNMNGDYATNENYGYLFVSCKKSESVYAYLKGIGTSVSLVSVADNLSQTKMTPKIVSIDGTPIWVSYKAEKDCYIVLSSQIRDITPVVYKFHNTDDLYSYIASVENSAESEKYSTVSYDFSNDVSGHYVNMNGDVADLSPYKMSNPINLSKGDYVSFTAKGTGTAVSMISKYDGIRYAPLVISVDSTVREYTYTATEDVTIVLSYNGEYSHTCTIKTSKYATKSYVDKEVVSNFNKPNFVSMFTRLAVIGDSLSSGELVTPKSGGGYTYTDVYGNSWLSYLARTINASARTHYSRGGQTAKSWLTEHTSKMQSDTPFGAYFIALGTNDKNTGEYPLGTINDVAGTDSFVGYYKQIISLVSEHAPNAVIFCVSLYDESTEKNVTYDAMIKSISDLYNNCFYVDYAKKSDITKDVGGAYISDGHWTSVGYPRVAENIQRIVNEIVSNNLNYFKFYTLNNSVGSQYED